MKAVSLANWQRIFTADGALLIPPEGKVRGALRIHTRVRPLRSVHQILNQMIERKPPGISEIRIGPVERTLTAEGEFAAVATLTAKTPTGGRVERTAGIIYGDDFYTLIDAAFQDLPNFEPMHATVTRMVFNFSLGLGDNRRRLYYYKLPPGWHGMRRDRVTTWIPTDYPANNARINVFDSRRGLADPTLMQDHMLFETLPGDLAPDAPQRPIAVGCQQGMTGRVTVVSGHFTGSPRMFFHTAELTDMHFQYLLRLECEEARLEENREIFLEMVRSVEALPASRQVPSAGSLIYWAD